MIFSLDWKGEMFKMININEDTHICHSCGEMMPISNACKMKIESDGNISQYHVGCRVPNVVCSDCGYHRLVCEECCEVDS